MGKSVAFEDVVEKPKKPSQGSSGPEGTIHPLRHGQRHGGFPNIDVIDEEVEPHLSSGIKNNTKNRVIWFLQGNNIN